ncbi:MAG: ABC transporter substrate-binding protein, partial [Pseudorhodoplanes sp.]
MSLSRRTLIRAGALALAAPAAVLEGLGNHKALAQSSAPAQTWRHGLSLFGELKYPAGFKNFDYVNPKAPRGGVVRQVAIGTFDNFNLVVGRVKGSMAAGIASIYDTLMASSLDEVSTEYGLLAESVSHPDDFSSCTYRLRAQARWHDGKPVTADDVIFSFEAFRKHDPQ